MEVTVYTTPTCPWCQKTKEFLKGHKVKYKEINVLEDKKAADYIVSKSGQTGVPQIEIKDGDEHHIIVGFDQEALTKTLKLGKKKK